MVDQINAAIETQSIRIANLESKLSGRLIPSGEDGQLVDRINYHLGVQSGLRQALFMLRAEEL